VKSSCGAATGEGESDGLPGIGCESAQGFERLRQIGRRAAGQAWDLGGEGSKILQ
jgi:hypothetical protein